MTEVTPLRIWEVMNTLVSWSRDAYPRSTGAEMTRRFIDETEDHPEGRRSQINLLFDFLGDEGLLRDDKEELIVDAVNRRFDLPGDALAWLHAQLEAVHAARPLERTTDTDGERPSLLETHRVRLAMRDFRFDVGRLPEPPEAARAYVRQEKPHIGDDADSLLMLMNSDYSDRAKADLVVETVGPFFYSDLEAIEWAAEVARRIQTRPRAVD